MSVVVWDGKTLAADKQATVGTLIRRVTKIARAGECLVGFSGDFQWFGSLVEWVAKGRVPADFPASQSSKDDVQPLLVIEPSGQILIYERSHHPVKIEGTQIAIGCGRDFAYGALHLGHDAMTAVSVAIACDAFCGQGIDTLTLKADHDQEAQPHLPPVHVYD